VRFYFSRPPTPAFFSTHPRAVKHDFASFPFFCTPHPLFPEALNCTTTTLGSLFKQLRDFFLYPTGQSRFFRRSWSWVTVPVLNPGLFSPPVVPFPLRAKVLFLTQIVFFVEGFFNQPRYFLSPISFPPLGFVGLFPPLGPPPARCDCLSLSLFSSFPVSRRSTRTRSHSVAVTMPVAVTIPFPLPFTSASSVCHDTRGRSCRFLFPLPICATLPRLPP